MNDETHSEAIRFEAWLGRICVVLGSILAALAALEVISLFSAVSRADLLSELDRAAAVRPVSALERAYFANAHAISMAVLSLYVGVVALALAFLRGKRWARIGLGALLLTGCTANALVMVVFAFARESTASGTWLSTALAASVNLAIASMAIKLLRKRPR